MTELGALALQLFVIVATSGAVYGAIRADIRHLHEGVKRAHERIDALWERD